jgi:hypothetical protein
MPILEVSGIAKVKRVFRPRRRFLIEVMVIIFLSAGSLIMPILGLQSSQVLLASYGMIEESTGHQTLVSIKIDDLSTLKDGELENLAKYDLLITATGTYNKAAIEKLRIYNPEMKIFGYRNVAFVDNRTASITLARANGWILKDAAGNEVYSTDFNFLKLADVRNASYREWVADQIHYSMTDVVSLDGVFGDCTNALITLSEISASPINPNTGALYSDQEWRDGVLALVQRVKEKLGKPYIANGAGMFCGSTSTGFWANQLLAEALLDVVDGVLLEGFVRWPNEAWRPSTNWRKDIEFLNYVSEKDKIAIAWTRCNGTLPSGATEYQIAMYGYATYLLAVSGSKSYFRATGYDEEFYNITRIDVGFPLEEYHMRDDAPLYEREFSKSLVLLNPTDNDLALSLTGNYKTIDEQPLLNVLLPAKSGMILIKKP